MGADMHYWLRDTGLESLITVNIRFSGGENSMARVAGTTSRRRACRSKIQAAHAIPGDRSKLL
jgi:hypothetical protein